MVVLAHIVVGPLRNRGKVVVLAHFVVGPLHGFTIERMSPPHGPATISVGGFCLTVEGVGGRGTVVVLAYIVVEPLHM